MPKTKKETTNTPKLYHGTTEIIAKTACIKGLLPYEVDATDNGVPRRILASTAGGICLTSSYPGLMAFETADHKERWGIIEVDASHLSPESLLPYEGFLVEKTKAKITNEEDRLKKLAQIRQSLSTHHRKWRESLNNFGMCIYAAEIPFHAISKVTIYNPQSNPVMTKAILGSVVLGSKFHPSNMNRQHMISRWLIGDNVTPEEWLGPTVYAKMEHAERERVSQVLRNKNGLDIFYSGTPNGKKVTWW